MKLLREREYKECPTCGDRRLVKDEAYCCDQCGKEIDLSKKHAQYDDLTVFYHRAGTDSERFMLCSIECIVKWLKAFKPPKDFYFISLPMLTTAVKVRAFQRYLK